MGDLSKEAAAALARLTRKKPAPPPPPRPVLCEHGDELWHCDTCRPTKE